MNTTEAQQGTMQRYVRFIISGVLTAVVGLSILAFLTEVLSLWYLASSVIAHICALVVNFILQKHWTFLDRERRRIVRKANLFALVSVFNLVLNTAAMYLLVDVLGLWYLLAQAIVMGGIALLNYTVYRSIIFNPGAPDERAQVDEH
jgi:putative flippase GtrA